jgi:hypothetical protein
MPANRLHLTLALASAAALLQIDIGVRAQAPSPGAVQAWERIATVLTSPRCINCHPSSDRPTQTDTMRLHQMSVTRGPADHGAPGLHCSACHQERNNPASGVPGAPHWHLAPRSMGWVGLSSGELCRRLKDPQANGNRSVADLVKHMTEDALVLWAWQPGRDGRGEERKPPPLTVAALGEALGTWAAAGAPCPD